MDTDQAIVLGVLTAALALFVSGRLRYDIVALLALLAVTLADIVPAEEAFAGFGHPAVITVAGVLVLSRGLLNSGVVDVITRWVSRVGDNPSLQIPVLTSVVAVCSGFMNNVGALALFLPVALRTARKSKLSPSLLLMPLAFGSLLGGLTTLIGTPPNIIIATFRAENGGDAFGMFDFTPVGLGVMAAGVAFVSLIGWRLIPARKDAAERDEVFDIEDYITEVSVPEGSDLVGKQVREVEQATDEGDVSVLGLIRGERRLPAPSGFEIIREEDILILRADSGALTELVDGSDLEMIGSKTIGEEELGSDEVALMEAVVMPRSLMEGRTARSLNLRLRFGVNLLAIARQGEPLRGRLDATHLVAGDVVLLQGRGETMSETLATLGCLPLAERGLRLGQERRIVLALAVFGGALAAAATGLVPVQVAIIAAAVTMVVIGLLSLNDAYAAIDWPIIILLGAMIPVGGALETTGAADLIAERQLAVADDMPVWIAIALLMITVMVLSDIVNNAAAAVLMAPIAVGLADGLGAGVDPFLMAVAIGASSAFLTPIGHQSNTLVMGPGGYKFSDYWRMGLPLEVVIVVVSVPLIMLVWPP